MIIKLFSLSVITIEWGLPSASLSSLILVTSLRLLSCSIWHRCQFSGGIVVSVFHGGKQWVPIRATSIRIHRRWYDLRFSWDDSQTFVHCYLMQGCWMLSLVQMERGECEPADRSILSKIGRVVIFWSENCWVISAAHRLRWKRGLVVLGVWLVGHHKGMGKKEKRVMCDGSCLAFYGAMWCEWMKSDRDEFQLFERKEFAWFSFLF